MTTESLQKQIDEQKITDRAMELFEAQSPHQLAVTLAHFEAKHAEAMNALDRMTDQRDQLAGVVSQMARAEDLLRAAVLELSGLEYPSLVLVDNINGFLAGEVLPSAAPEELPPAVLERVSEALGEAMDCGRVWTAWGYGTMGPDDFSPVGQDEERVHEIATAAISAWLQTK